MQHQANEHTSSDFLKLATNLFFYLAGIFLSWRKLT